MLKKKIKNEDIIKSSLVLAIDKLTTDIKSSVNTECNKERAETIKILAQAYDIIQSGWIR